MSGFRSQLKQFQDKELKDIASKLPAAFVCDLWIDHGRENAMRVIEINP
jgi:hypothetical protein